MANQSKDTAPATGFSELAARPHADVLIIGGGVNGVATFRDLAMQGIDVALVERGDIISGASAASSHMIHGGVRYLENGEFRLVHEAVTERNALLQTAPHYVRPLRTTIPIFSTFSGIMNAPLRFLRHGAGKPQERGALLIKAGLIMYDSFSRGSGKHRVPRHAFHGRKRSLRELPHMRPDVKYTATYWDASLHDPERLAIDLVHDGRELGGDKARLANYTAAVGVEDGKVVLEDTDTNERITFTADVVVNASGPWTDFTNEALGQKTQFMGGTKGSHVVLDQPELLEATGGREIFFEHSDGRIVLIYPLKDRVLVGTTDLEHDMNDPIVCTPEEVAYFAELVKHVFPTIGLDTSKIVYRFSGVRPLPGHGDENPGFVSRDYRIEKSKLPVSDATLFSLVGGKWTTFRASAERVADNVLEALRIPRRVSTAGVAIGGGKNYPRTDRARAAWLDDNERGLGRARASKLLDRYGTRATEIIEAILADDTDAPLEGAERFTTAELRYLAEHEQVRHLEDMLMRRTSLAFVGLADESIAREVAEVVAPVLGWDKARIDEEVVRGVAAVNRANPDYVPAKEVAAKK